MNLPDLGKFGQIPAIKYEAPKTTSQIQQPLAQKKPSIFASNLKSIFQEKELPPGHPELELEEGHKLQNIDHKSQIIEQKPFIRQDQKGQAAALKPFFPIREKPFVSPQTVKPASPVLKVPPAVSPKPKTVFPSVSAVPLAPLAAKPSTFQQKPSFASSLSKLPGQDFPLEKQPTYEPPVSKPVASNGQAINGLQDLAVFENRMLQAWPLDALAKKIKSLVAKYGYFEVIFNLEKSQTYKNYINTGLKLLSGQPDFESLDVEGTGDYLTKEEFEKFTDLLAKIQTS